MHTNRNFSNFNVSEKYDVLPQNCMFTSLMDFTSEKSVSFNHFTISILCLRKHHALRYLTGYGRKQNPCLFQIPYTNGINAVLTGKSWMKTLSISSFFTAQKKNPVSFLPLKENIPCKHLPVPMQLYFHLCPQTTAALKLL